jgi:hypothetical protein
MGFFKKYFSKKQRYTCKFCIPVVITPSTVKNFMIITTEDLKEMKLLYTFTTEIVGSRKENCNLFDIEIDKSKINNLEEVFKSNLSFMYMINEKSSGYNENEKNTLLKCS